MEPSNPGELSRLSAEIARVVADAVKEALAPQTPPRQPPLEEEKSVNMSRIIDSLSARLALFKYDPEEEATFENWFVRYEKLLDEEGELLEDKAKARLVLSKLDGREYSLFANRLLPMHPDNLTFSELISKLKETFKSTSSEFRRRYDFLQTSFTGGALEEYTGTILRRFTTSRWKEMTDDQVCCLIWIAGLRDESFADIRTKALQLLESKTEITLLELETKIKRLLEIRDDSQRVGTSKVKPEINAIKAKKASTPQKSPPSPCPKCGGNHWSRDCKIEKVTCNVCGKDGHTAKFCYKNKNHSKKSTKKFQKKKISVVAVVQTVPPKRRIYLNIPINGTDVRMQLDTGSDVTVINTRDWRRIGTPPLVKSSEKLMSACGNEIKTKGVFRCKCQLHGKEYEGAAHVADTSTLLGMDWMALDSSLLHSLVDSPDTCVNSVQVTNKKAPLIMCREELLSLLKKSHPNVFKSGLGTCTKTRATLRLKPGAKPVFRKARPVPYARLPAVTGELQRLVAKRVLAPTNHSDWATPIVVVMKKNGELRLCADFSTGLNDCLQQHQHPLPTLEDSFSKLNGGRLFTQIDLAEAYLQVETDPEASELLCINTHLGLFAINVCHSE
ncbi:unnamed protein product [Caenorhabditis sp. 36 PRJEB53466]|nr:unnamed protein product [Caenorhabditis sp. 36 PRJEB53466]